jgi:hypothetical protein
MYRLHWLADILQYVASQIDTYKLCNSQTDNYIYYLYHLD